MRWTCRLLVAVLAFAAFTSDAWAQRREIVDDLLKALIESQLNRGRPPQQRPPEVVPPRPDSPTRAARTEVQAMSADAMQLAQSLQIEARSQPQLRVQLGRLIQVQAALDAQSLGRGGHSLEQMALDYSTIDRDWRNIEYKLLQSADLTQRSKLLVKAISEHDRKLCQMLGIDPQLDRTELVRLSGELTTNYRQLLDDIYQDLRRSPQMPALVQQGQQLQLRFRQATSLIDRAGYDQLVVEFKRCQQNWRAFSASLHPVATDRIRRSMLRVEQSGRLIQEQLWIPIELDPVLIRQLVQTVEADAERLMSVIALPDLLAHPHPDKVLNAAREFHTTCGPFIAAAQGQFDRDSLLWDYRLFDVQWREFANQCRGFNSPAIQQQLIDVESRITLLRAALGIDTGLDREQLTQLAASLDELAYLFEQTASTRVLNSSKYSAQFKTQFTQELESLHHAAHTLHDQVTTQHDHGPLAVHVTAMQHAWNTCKARVTQCQPEHQQLLYQTMAQIEPHMVSLQVMFAR
jgi:hypothetical protein